MAIADSSVAEGSRLHACEGRSATRAREVDCVEKLGVRSLLRFDLKQPGLREISEVIHDIDVKESKFGRAETAGVAACVAGMCKLNRDDETRIAQGSALLEGLLASFS